MKRPCPDCKGWKTQVIDDWIHGKMQIRCTTCNGTGFVTSKRNRPGYPSRRKVTRLKTSKEIKERRAKNN